MTNFAKIGVLGGGQLGRMLVEAGLQWDINFAILDPDPHAPCSCLREFRVGKLTDYDAVMDFGASCDVITIEIENVNTDALKELERQGKKVFPSPNIVEMIKDKRKQKQFYRDHGIPTADFVLTNSRADVARHFHLLPAVHKLATGGYDGRGVQVLKNESALPLAFDDPAVLERFVDLQKEISVIVARNAHGEIKTFPAVEMVFHPEANLVEYLLSPALISNELEEQAQGLARCIAEQLQLVGLLAIEMFVTKEGQLLVNEMAPRPHNSGHQTIEGNVSSQYQQLLRAILNLPLGETGVRQHSAMVNLLGDEGFNGLARYDGLEKVLAMPDTYLHLYGKKSTKPFRKMGHVTILGNDLESLLEKVSFVKNHLKVIA